MGAMTKHTLTLANGQQIAYWTYHDSKKPTLVMIHGFTGSHEGFQYVAPLLTDFHLIIPDLPGFGQSPLPHSKLTLRELGSLMIDLIQALHLPETPHLLGHSMGSLVVAEMLRQHPSLFAHKIILASPVPMPVGLAETRRVGVLFTRLYYLLGHRLPGGHRIATSRKISWLGTSAIMTTKDKQLQQTIHGHHYKNLDYISDFGWNRRLHKEINHTGMSRYKAVLRPFDVLIVNGNRDNVTPLPMQKKVAHATGAKLAVIPDTGHLSHYETPQQVADAITTFLRDARQ